MKLSPDIPSAKVSIALNQSSENILPNNLMTYHCSYLVNVKDVLIHVYNFAHHDNHRTPVVSISQ